MLNLVGITTMKTVGKGAQKEQTKWTGFYEACEGEGGLYLEYL